MSIQHWQDNWTNTHWNWQKLTLSQKILVILIFTALATTFISALFNQDSSETWLSGFAQNFSTEMMGAIITFVLFEQVLNRQQREDTQKQLDEKELSRLKSLLASNESVVTKIAVAELRAKGWLWDGSLENVNLREANLERMNLKSVNLTGAALKMANLEQANLSKANLEQADLSGVKLKRADLEAANLKGTDLFMANLEQSVLYNVNLKYAKLSTANLELANLRNANLEYTNLEAAKLVSADLEAANLTATNLSKANLAGANLKAVNLEYANLYGVRCDEKTILPDGIKWSPSIDWSQFGAIEIKDKYEWFVYLHHHRLLRQKFMNVATYIGIMQKLYQTGYITHT